MKDGHSQEQRPGEYAAEAINRRTAKEEGVLTPRTNGWQTG